MDYALQFNTGFCYLISFILFLLVYFFKLKKNTLKDNILICFLWVYITQVVNICFFPISANYADIVLNIEKISRLGNLHNIEIGINYFDEYDGIQQILNVIMLIPFGILVPFVYKNNSIVKNIIICISFPIFIESMQYLLTNVFYITIHFTDINDVINNIIGGLFGLIINYHINSIIVLLQKMKFSKQ